MATKYWISSSSGSFSTAGNWSDGKAPASNDTLIFNNASSVACDADLDAHLLTDVTLIVETGYAGRVGAVSGGAGTPLRIGSGSITMPRTSGGSSNLSGSTRVMVQIDSGGVANIETSNPTCYEPQYPTVQLSGGFSSVTVIGGNVGFAARPGETISVDTLVVSRGIDTNPPVVFIGLGATVTDLYAAGGTLTSRGSNTTALARVANSVLICEGSGAFTELDVDPSGRVVYNGSGGITALNLRGEFNASGCAGVTITDCSCYRGYSLNENNGAPGSFTHTNPIQFPDGVQAGTLLTAPGVKMSLEAI